MLGLLFLIGIALYAPLLMTRRGEHRGQTLGKQMVGTRVVPVTGGELSTGTAYLRELVAKSLLSWFTFGLYGLLDYMWCLWDEQYQCLHDKIAGTLVVQA